MKGNVISRCIVTFACVVICVFCLTSCQSNAVPVFAKELVYTSDYDFSVTYVCGTNCNEKLESVKIIDSDDVKECVIYGATEEKGINQKKVVVDLGVSLKENCDTVSFSQMEIKWGNGTTEKVDIGSVNIIKTCEDITEAVVITEENKKASICESDAILKLENEINLDVLEDYYSNLYIAGCDITHFSNGKEIKVQEGEKLNYSLAKNTAYDGDYNIVNVELLLKCTYPKTEETDNILIRIMSEQGLENLL